MATRKSRIAREVDEILSQGKGSSSGPRVLRSDFGRLVEVRAPAVRLVTLPVGARDKHGDLITEYTPDWARQTHEKIADSVRLEGARYSGHDIEGHVRIKGKRYSAFTSGGPDDFVIVVRGARLENDHAMRRSHATRRTIRGFHDVSTPDQRRFVTEQGDVEIQEVSSQGSDWDVLPLGGAVRRVRGREAAVTEARSLGKKSSEWRRGDLAGEDAALEVTTKYGRSFGERGLSELQANLRRESRTGAAGDFDRGYVVGYARGVAGAGRGRAQAGRVGAGFGVDYTAGRTYPPPGR